MWCRGCALYVAKRRGGSPASCQPGSACVCLSGPLCARLLRLLLPSGQQPPVFSSGFDTMKRGMFLPGLCQILHGGGGLYWPGDPAHST